MLLHVSLNFCPIAVLPASLQLSLQQNVRSVATIGREGRQCQTEYDSGTDSTARDLAPRPLVTSIFRGEQPWCVALSNEIADLVARAAASDERVERQLEVIATVPSLSDEPVARFKLTLSLKRRA